MSNTIHEVYAYLCVKNVDEALEFYRNAFGAAEHFRLTEPAGRVGHIEIHLGNQILMLSEEYPELDILAPDPESDSTFSLHLHVDNADAMYTAAIKAGARSLREPEDQFFGERMATLRDPFGYRWMIGHSVEDVSTDEMQKRYTALFETNT